MSRNNNPYSGFKDDPERRLALRSRDVRLTLIALICAFAGGLSPYILGAAKWLIIW